MSKFDADYNKAKSLVVDKIQAWVDEQRALKAAGQKTSSSGVKQAERAKRSITASTDETFQYLVEEALSKDLSGEAIKNKIRGLIERQFPQSLRLLTSDRIHHKNALELVELVSQQSPEVVIQFLQRSEKEGFFFGDSLENTLGAFFTEPAHTGAFPQDSAGTINYPKEYGAPGERLVSGHPAGTNDPRFKFESKIYNSGDELFDAIKPALAYSADALDRALFADKPRQEMAEMLLRNQGLLEPGESIRDIPPGPRYQAIQKFAEQPENKVLIEGARQQTANVAEFIEGGVTTRSNLARVQQQFPELEVSKFPLGSPELEAALQLPDYRGGGVRLNMSQLMRNANATSLRKAQKLAKTVSRTAGEIPIAGYVAGPLLGFAMGMSPGEAFSSNLPGVSDIEGNELAVRERVPGTTDMFVDPRTNMVDPRTIEEAQSGPLGLAYKDGKPITVPYGSVAGTMDTMEIIKQAGQQILDVNEARARRFFGNEAVDFTKGAAKLFFGI